MYLADIVHGHQYVPCCQVSVHKPFLSQVLHSSANVPTELQQLFSQYVGFHLVNLARTVVRVNVCLLGGTKV